MDANNTPLQKLLNNRKLLILVMVVFVMVPLVLLILSTRGSTNNFELVSVTPQSGTSISPGETTATFEFSQEMPLVQKETFAVTVEPRVDFIYGIIGNKLSVNLSDLLLTDGQTYTVTLTNLISRAGEVIRSQSTAFTVNLSQETKDFINGLPYSGDGFKINKISDTTLLVEVTKKPDKKYKDEAIKFLQENDIDETKFNIAVILPGDQALDDSGSIKHFD